MTNTAKVSHFFGAPTQRMLETYCTNITYVSISTKEKLLRSLMRFFHQNSCLLRCGRTKYKHNGQTTIILNIISTQLISSNIWHVEGKINGKHKVILEIDTNSKKCDVIKRL